MITIRTVLLALAVSLALSGSVEAQPKPAGELVFSEESRITVSGTSTIHDWSCTSETVNGTLSLNSGSALTARIARGEVRLPVESLTCERDRMNDNTWEALKYEDHPEIVFELIDTSVGEDSAGWTLLTASGTLTVAGRSRSIDLSARARSNGDTALQIRGAKNLTMTAFGVEPPTALFGAIKARDSVTVDFDVHLDSDETTQAVR